MIGNYIAAGVIAIIIGLALAYIIKAKRSGKRCIGCPDSASCSGNCSCCAGTAGCNKNIEK